MAPPVPTAAVPLVGVETAVTVKVSPSGSVSLARTSITLAVLFLATVAVSALAVGAWLATVMFTVAAAEVAVPSLTVKVKLSATAVVGVGRVGHAGGTAAGGARGCRRWRPGCRWSDRYRWRRSGRRRWHRCRLRVMASGVLEVTGTLWALATGAVLLTVTLTLPVAVLPWPSLIVYVKLSVPVKLAFGV